MVFVNSSHLSRMLYCLLVAVLLLASSLGSFIQAAPNPVAERVDPRPLIATTPDWEIQISSITGGLVKITDGRDAQKMNWVTAGRPWGIMRVTLPEEKLPVVFDHPKSTGDYYPEEVHDRFKSIYQGKHLRLEVERTLEYNGTFIESYTLTNEGSTELILPDGACSITIPFNNSPFNGVPGPATNNAIVRLSADGKTAWANGVRAFGQGRQLGLILKEGSLASYCVLKGKYPHESGDLAFNLSGMKLAPAGSTVVKWTLFWHKDDSDFWTSIPKRLVSSPDGVTPTLVRYH